MWFIYAVALFFILGTFVYLLSDKVKSFVHAIWQRWFKDSEVNFLADLATVAGGLVEIIDDPALTDLLSFAGISPATLMVIGIVIRLARMSRNRAMVPFTRTER